MSEYNSTDKRLWLGVILIGIGGVWLLEEVNLIPYYISEYLLSWQTILITIGLYLLLARKKTEAGIIMISIGTVFLLQDMGFFYVRNIWEIALPAVLIAIGVSLIIRRTGHDHRIPDGEKKNDIDYLDDFAILGGRERTIDSQSFKGGRLTAMFGGSVVDFTSADLAPGTNVLDIFVMFGGAEVIVPPDWTVHVEVTSILGGFSDKRSAALKVVPNPDKVLVIKGFVMFGGGDVKFHK